MALWVALMSRAPCVWLWWARPGTWDGRCLSRCTACHLKVAHGARLLYPHACWQLWVWLTGRVSFTIKFSVRLVSPSTTLSMVVYTVITYHHLNREPATQSCTSLEQWQKV